MNRTGKPPGIPVYLDCELCGRALSPRRVDQAKPGEPFCCPSCARQERNLAADSRSPSFIRSRALARKARESRDAVARRLKG